MRSIALGLGNLLNRDAGAGIHALRALKTHLGPGAGVEALDASTIGPGLLSLIEECEHVLILDVADGRREPGALIELHGAEIPPYAGVRLARHQVTFQEVLGLAQARGRLPPHLHLIGVQPADMSAGLELSPIVAAAVPAILSRARIMLTAWGLLTPCDWG